MAGETEARSFSLYLTSNGDLWLVATLLHSAALDCSLEDSMDNLVALLPPLRGCPGLDAVKFRKPEQGCGTERLSMRPLWSA